MRAHPLLITTLCLTVSTFAFTGMSLAKGPKAKKVKTEARAELTPCCGDPLPEPDAKGKAKRKTETRSNVVQNDEFEAKVKVPVPSTGLGIIDEATATAADLRLILARSDTPYAECLLEFDEIETEDEDGEVQTEAEYKVKVGARLRKGVLVLQEDKGECDTDLAAEGVQAGVPAVQEGDVATVSIVPPAPASAIPFLEGTFMKKK